MGKRDRERVFIVFHALRLTLPETNIAPENRPLEKEIPIGNHHILGWAILVLGSVSWGVLKTLPPKRGSTLGPMFH